MITLALDLGTHCGWALLRADGRIESGCESFNPKIREGAGQRWIKFRAWLVEVKNTHGINRIAYELVIGGMPGQVYAAQVYGGFVAVLQHFAEHHQLPYEGFHVGTIKKAWTGNGSAKKSDMIARCKELGFTPANDNQADAIALLHLACNRVPKLPIERQAARIPKRKPKPNPDTRTRPMALSRDPF